MFTRLFGFVLRASAATSALTVTVVLVVLAVRWAARPSANSAEGVLARADQLAWNENWAGAAPIYARAEVLFERSGDRAHALYAKVSQVPVLMESSSLPTLIGQLNDDLHLPAAADPDVRLRILEVKGRCEEEYDAGLAALTFAEVEKLALDHYKVYLASRASGERGILSFTLGHFEDAAARVKRAYAIAKYLGDPAAHVRFAEMIGMGLTQMGKPRQALVFLSEAIDTQKQHPEVAIPYVALNSKIECLSDLGRYKESLELADRTLKTLQGPKYLGQIQSLLTTRSNVLRKSGQVQQAILGYLEALSYARRLSAWRAITNIDGALATAYEDIGDHPAALSAIDDAIRANSESPQEVFLMPGNLALKARVLAAMGRRADAERIYAKGANIIDVLLSAVPTPEVEQLLLTQLGDLYAGYFRLVSDQGRLADAFSIVERARGRIVAQQLEFDGTSAPRLNDPVEVRLQQLELKILNPESDHGSGAAYVNKTQLPAVSSNPRTGWNATASLPTLQDQLHHNELLIEYVLATPASYTLVVSKAHVSRYVLPSEEAISKDTQEYRNALLKRTSDLALGRKLFDELLGFTREYRGIDNFVIVADGPLHLLPFGALVDDSHRYLIESKTVTASPSGTVLSLLRTRSAQSAETRAYLGVAPWTDTHQSDRWVLIKRGGEQDENTLMPLPHSLDEVESIAAIMPRPSTLLIGSQATRAKFVSLPLHEYRVLHLALHGTIDPVFADRSSLRFAPSRNDDGQLEARDIRRLKLNADLVTLSACDTAVGPVSAAGIESLDTAFIEAGADAVVSTLWEVQDHYADAFMKSFYRHLKEEGKAAALREAEVDLLHQGAAPYDWAAYELVGNSSGSPLGTHGEVARR